MQGADGGERRRRTWSADQKQRIIAESFAPGGSVAEVARRYGLNANMLFTWRRRERADVNDVIYVQRTPLQMSHEAAGEKTRGTFSISFTNWRKKEQASEYWSLPSTRAGRWAAWLEMS